MKLQISVSVWIRMLVLVLQLVLVLELVDSFVRIRNKKLLVENRKYKLEIENRIKK